MVYFICEEMFQVWCGKVCGAVKSLADFYKSTESSDGHRPDCVTCFKVVQDRRFREKGQKRNLHKCLDCDALVYRSSVRCRPCANRVQKVTPTWSPNKGGYLRANIAGKTVLQHRMIMEQVLGRPLLPMETVHHKNGVRTDNRPENLEVWVTWQPSGQRVEDVLAWARAVIDLYESTATTI